MRRVREAAAVRLVTASCGAFSSTGAGGAPQQCTARVTHVGVALLRRTGEVDEAWLAFTCSAHAGEVVGARELLDRDRAVLEDWRARERDALAGKGWRRPAPLAVGAAARELVRRARAR